MSKWKCPECKSEDPLDITVKYIAYGKAGTKIIGRDKTEIELEVDYINDSSEDHPDMTVECPNCMSIFQASLVGNNIIIDIPY